MTKEELEVIVGLHEVWLAEQPDGCRADLRKANQKGKRSNHRAHSVRSVKHSTGGASPNASHHPPALI